MTAEQLQHGKGLIQKLSAQREKHLTYNWNFDTDKYQALYSLRTSDPFLYETKRQALDSTTIFNLQTAIGERLNAALSRRVDIIRNGKIRDKYTGEALENIYERGRLYRVEHGSSAGDQLRETAEVIGFREIQRVLVEGEAPIGTMMLSISPPGGHDSIYNHNFYDIFTLQQDEEGNKYIDSRRYSSALDYEAYINKVLSIKPDYFEDETVPKDLPFDAYFLSHPIRIDPDHKQFLSPDVIHQDFHKNHEAMLEDDFKEVIRICTPFIVSYINTLVEDPFDIHERNITYDALINKADIVAGNLKKQTKAQFQLIYGAEKTGSATREELYFWGSQPVREAATGCGYSGSASGNKNAASAQESAALPFSVAEFGERTLQCKKCPMCGAADIEAIIAGGKITCPECNASAEYNC